MSHIQFYSNQHNFWHGLPDLDMSEEDCILESNTRENTWLTYPGACALEYNIVTNILLEHMMQWDPQNQEVNGLDVLGTVEAFGPADKE